MLRELMRGVCDLVFPHNCLRCKRHVAEEQSAVLCRACRDAIILNRPPFCPQCARTLSGNSRQAACAQCASTHYFFDCAWSPTVYAEAMQELIHLFKYQHRTALRKPFGTLIADFIDQYQVNINRFDYFIPIPLHPAKIRERGYNQSQLIADDLTSTYKPTVLADALIRTRNTQQQAFLGKKERWTNVNRAFTIRNSRRLADTSVLIVDDLLTTGATASEAARVLKEAGVRTVGVLTLSIAL